MTVESGRGIHQHTWTEEELLFIRLNYRYTVQSQEEMALTIGCTVNAVRHQLIKARLCRSVIVSWSEEEENFLREKYNSLSVFTIAKKLHRSASVVTAKAYRMKVSGRRRGRDNWFNMKDVTLILGVDSGWVSRRLQNGSKLKMSPHSPNSSPGRLGNAAWHISERSLRDFIRRYPEELAGRNVDMVMLVDILAGVKS